MLTYLDLTESIRSDTDYLFIRFKKPHRPISTQTLSRWIKYTLNINGIDTSTFIAHITRHAATSAAHRLGVNMDHIRKTAGWIPGSHALARFYNRPITNTSDDCFGRAKYNE